jgi:predicted house-cleaning noncanonical NTP pyrophosphatase (MazG superfamily)
VKLVRDRIPELAAANGQPGSFQQATDAEFARCLRTKLLEDGPPPGRWTPGLCGHG